jgi:uncharacterized protein
MPAREHLRFAIQADGEVSATVLKPSKAYCLLLLAHGAGAGMNHPFLETLAANLADLDVATFRYQFPYMEQHRRTPDREPVATATVVAAVGAASRAAPALPLFAGGKSFGGRMTSAAAAKYPLPNVRGVVFFGFPLHPPNQPSTKRAEHLRQVQQPMLFLAGSRDAFAELALLRPVCAQLGSRTTLHVIPSADHSFHMPKSSGRTDAEVQMELAQTFAAWSRKMLGALPL